MIEIYLKDANIIFWGIWKHWPQISIIEHSLVGTVCVSQFSKTLHQNLLIDTSDIITTPTYFIPCIFDFSLWCRYQLFDRKITGTWIFAWKFLVIIFFNFALSIIFEPYYLHECLYFENILFNKLFKISIQAEFPNNFFHRLVHPSL